jgi:hypothetical protein
LHRLEKGGRYAVEPIEAKRIAAILGQVKENRGQQMAQMRHQFPLPDPSFEAVCLEESRTYHHVDVVVTRGQQPGNVRGRMAEIRIHRHQPGISVLVRPTDAGLVGGADTQFFCAVQNREVRVLAGQPVQDDTGAVGRTVVNEQQIDIEPDGQDAGNDDLHVFRLVVRGDHHECSVFGCHAPPATCSASTMRAANSSTVVRAVHPVASANFSGFPTSGPRLIFCIREGSIST